MIDLNYSISKAVYHIKKLETIYCKEEEAIDKIKTYFNTKFINLTNFNLELKVNEPTEYMDIMKLLDDYCEN
ncbi:hypothetical protein POWCR01_000167000 [Plasmodium ovale]|uniref:PIR protein n=1 Tax=Plasmodium ovale TaxID=36330 RepID=A0A1C3KJA5_PLAOA|nr:hypothetical protein POWCR01_000167000 [Plasmodium ovale]